MFSKPCASAQGRVPCTRSRVSGSFEGYYTMTPRSGLNKTAPAAVLHGSMFSKPCASAQGRVQCTRAAAQAAALRLLYHISKLALRVPLVFTKKHGIYAARLMLRLRLAFTNRTYYTIFPFPRPTVEKRGTGRAPCTEHRTRPPAARKRGAPVKCAAKAVSPSPRRP